MVRAKRQTLSSSADLLAAVNIIRDRIAALHEQRLAITNLPDAKAIEAGIRKALHDDIPASFASGFDASFLLADPKGYGGLDRAFKASPVSALAVIIGEDVVAKALVAHALKAAEVEGGCIDSGERAARLSLIDEDLHEAEREEERLCREAEGTSFVIERRVDANPAWLIADDSELEARR